MKHENLISALKKRRPITAQRPCDDVACRDESNVSMILREFLRIENCTSRLAIQCFVGHKPISAPKFVYDTTDTDANPVATAALAYWDECKATLR